MLSRGKMTTRWPAGCQILGMPERFNVPIDMLRVCSVIAGKKHQRHRHRFVAKQIQQFLEMLCFSE